MFSLINSITLMESTLATSYVVGPAFSEVVMTHSRKKEMTWYKSLFEATRDLKQYGLTLQCPNYGHLHDLGAFDH